MTYSSEAEASAAGQLAFDSVKMAGEILLLHLEYYEALATSERYMHNVGGLLDPTLYKRMLSEENGKRNSAAAAAARRFISELRDCGYLPVADQDAGGRRTAEGAAE